MRKAIRIALWSITGLCLISGATGAAAVYLGAKQVLGSPSATTSGSSCFLVAKRTERRGSRIWVRHFITTDIGDGQTHLRTAVRVAKAVQEAEKADLVQISVVSKNGPVATFALRGRAIGAQVTYIPNPSIAPEIAAERWSGFYVDGTAQEDGEFHGMRVKIADRTFQEMADALQKPTGCENQTSEAVEAENANAQ